MKHFVYLFELDISIRGIKILRYTIICFLFSWNIVVYSQTLDFKNFTTKDGLLTDEVYNLHQDKQGYLWVFSKFGTLKYNGTSFKETLKNLPLKDSFIYCIYENDNGSKWVANSNAKIYEVRNDSAIMIEGIEQLSVFLKNSVSEITKLYVDDSLNIYVSTKGHCYKLCKNDKFYASVDICENLKSNCITVTTFAVKDEILRVRVHQNDKEFDSLCGSKHTYLELVDENKKIEIKLPANYLQSAVSNLKRLNGAIYFTCLNFVYKILDSKVKTIELDTRTLLCFRMDRNNHLWIGCLNGGLYELNEKDSVVNHYFGDLTINDLCVDHQNGLWVSTPTKGLFYSQHLDKRYFKEIQTTNSTIGFIKKSENKLFITRGGGDVFIFENNRIKQIRSANNNPVKDVLENKGEYLISLVFSIESINTKTGKRKELSTFELPSVSHIISKGSDTLIYVCRKGICLPLKSGRIKLLDFNQKVLSSELQGQVLWLGTENGVYQHKTDVSINWNKGLDDGKATKVSLFQPDFLKTTKDIAVTKIVKDNYNKLWFCTSGSGLYSFENEEMLNYNANDGLPSNIINSVSFTDNNSMLLSTNKGLFFSELDRSTFKYSKWKNIFEGEVQNALYFEGEVFIHTNSGLFTLNYKSMRRDTDKVFFNLASIEVDAKEVNAEEFVKLQSNQNSVIFKYDVITFSTAKPLIKYILEGVEKDSGTVDNSIIKIDRLPPGNYTLSAFPMFNNNSEKKIIAIPFVVEPAFWQTRFFYISTVVALLCIIGLIFWLILSRNKRKAAIKMKNEQLILEYKLIALKAQINPHFMSNCLSAIQDLVLNDKNDKATFYIAQFGLMVRQILDFSSKQLITLQEELNLLEIYVELEQLRFESKFEYNLEIEKDISLKETYLPPLIFNPLVENAIWHGLLPIREQKRGKLTITIKRKGTNLVLSIQDNGVGREVQKKASGSDKDKSYGIQITQQRLANINYLNNRNDSKLVYDDLKDSTDISSGTLVTIYLPDNLNPFQNEQD